MVVVDEPVVAQEDGISAVALRQRAIAQTDSLEAAWRLLKQWALDDDAVYRAVTIDWLDRICYEQTYATIRANRSAFWQAPLPTPSGPPMLANRLEPRPDDASGLWSVAEENLRNLLDYRLKGGRRLGSVTRADLLQEAAMYGRQAKTLTVRRRWLLLIAKRLKPDVRVDACLTHDDLAALQRTARGE